MAIGIVSQISRSHMVLDTSSARSTPASGGVSGYARDQQERLQIEFLARQMADMRSSLAAIRKVWHVKDLAEAGQAASATSANLGLAGAMPAVLASDGEINATPTSYGPTAPSWGGASDAAITIGGTYDGSLGDQTLTFTASRSSTVGSDGNSIRVHDSEGTLLEAISMRRVDPAGQVYTLSNGLEVSFDVGSINAGDTFTVDVSSTTGSVVDPDGAFDGSPGFEDGTAVTAGTFTVNGTIITVQTGDTLNTVLESINQSAAGVTATLDLDTEQVVLTSDDGGAAQTVTVGDDTSGFLAAVKLDTATLRSGEDAAADQPLQDVAGFESVTAGSILVNGVSIAFDPATDSLADIVGLIDASSAGVSASLDDSGQRVVLTGDDDEQDMILDDNGSGLLGALGLTEGIHEAVVGTGGEGMTSVRSREIADHLRTIYKAINAVFEGPDDTGDPGSWMVRARGRMQGALEKSFKEDDRDLAADFGLDLDFENMDEATEAILPDSRRLELGVQDLLRRRAGTTKEFLFGNRSGRKGLIGLLETNHDAVMDQLMGMAGNRGLSLDRYL